VTKTDTGWREIALLPSPRPCIYVVSWSSWKQTGHLLRTRSGPLRRHAQVRHGDFMRQGQAALRAPQ